MITVQDKEGEIPWIHEGGGVYRADVPEMGVVVSQLVFSGSGTVAMEVKTVFGPVRTVEGHELICLFVAHSREDSAFLAGWNEWVNVSVAATDVIDLMAMEYLAAHLPPIPAPEPPPGETPAFTCWVRNIRLEGAAPTFTEVDVVGRRRALDITSGWVEPGWLGYVPWLLYGNTRIATDPSVKSAGALQYLQAAQDGSVRIHVRVNTAPKDNAAGFVLKLEARSGINNRPIKYIGGWADEIITLSVSAGEYSVFFTAEWREEIPEQWQWQPQPDGVMPDNTIQIRRVEMDPPVYDPPGFAVWSPVDNSEQIVVPPACAVFRGKAPAVLGGLVSSLVTGGCVCTAPDVGRYAQHSPDCFRTESTYAAWRNPYPPSIANPAQGPDPSDLGDRWTLLPGRLHGNAPFLPTYLELDFDCPSAGYVSMLLHIYKGADTTYHTIDLQQNNSGTWTPVRTWTQATPVPDMPLTVRVPVTSAGLHTLRLAVSPWEPTVPWDTSFIRVYAPGFTGYQPVTIAGCRFATGRPSLMWEVPAADAATAQVIYTCTLSGAEAGLPDLDLPMTSFACRLRTATPSYLSVTVPSRPGLAADIAARASGTLRVFKGYRLTSGHERSEEIARGTYNRMSSAGGGRSSSLTLVGYHRYGEGAGTLRPLREVMVDGNDMEGRRTVRAAVDMWMRPGDVATWEGQTLSVGAIAIHVSVERATMDLTEA